QESTCAARRNSANIPRSRGDEIVQAMIRAIRETASVRSPKQPTNDEERWAAVVRRDTAADNLFYYSVSTTGVYCRPSCPSRRALRRNVRFHPTREHA